MPPNSCQFLLYNGIDGNQYSPVMELGGKVMSTYWFLEGKSSRYNINAGKCQYDAKGDIIQRIHSGYIALRDGGFLSRVKIILNRRPQSAQDEGIKVVKV